MCSSYFPGARRPGGKAKRPLSSLTTVTVIVPPAFFALTSTPSIAPSSLEPTFPESVDCAVAARLKRANTSIVNSRMEPLNP